MPFKSKSQERYLYANHPDVAKEFQAATGNDAALPEKLAKVGSGKPRTRRTSMRDFDSGMLHSSEINKK